MKGYRTYLTVIVLIIHQLLNAFGFNEVTGDQLSITIDVILGIAAFIFRALAKLR